MRVTCSSLAGLLVATCATVCTPMPARAALGGDAASVQADAVAARGSARSTSLPSYEIRDTVTDGNERIREFLSRSGVVFGVSWSGAVMPDLKALLGDHFAAYAAALAGVDHKGLRRFVRVATADLVVESSGHMRAFSGRAYLPALLPSGVAAADIR